MLEYRSPLGNDKPSAVHKARAAGELEDRRENIRHALSLGLPQASKGLYERHSDVMKLACYGPSLEDNWEHIQADEGDLWTVSGANRFLWEKGIAPLFHLESDPRPHKAELLSGACPTTTYLIASRCHRNTFDALKDKRVLLYHLNVKDEAEGIDDVKIPAAWTMGNVALMVGLHFAGYQRAIVYGMDGSFTDKQHASDHPNEEVIEGEFFVDGRKYISHPTHIVALESLLSIVNSVPHGTISFVGDGLIPHAYRQYTRPQ